MIRRVVSVLAGEPALLSTAIRSSMLAAIAFGLDWSGEAVAAAAIAVESWTALLTRVFAVPSREVAATVRAAVDARDRETAEFLAAVEAAPPPTEPDYPAF